jgi:hypothetical protein
VDVLFSSDLIVVAAMMLLGVFSLRQLIEADLRLARARRRVLKALAKSLGGTYKRVKKHIPSGELVEVHRHGLQFKIFFEVVMAADDASSYTRVQLAHAGPGRCFASFAVVPEDFLERADNLLFGREDRILGDAELDQQVLIRSEEGSSLEALRSPEVIEAFKIFLESGEWNHEFLVESFPDLLRVSHNSHLVRLGDLEPFVLASMDLLAALPSLGEEE